MGMGNVFKVFFLLAYYYIRKSFEQNVLSRYSSWMFETDIYISSSRGTLAWILILYEFLTMSEFIFYHVFGVCNPCLVLVAGFKHWTDPPLCLSRSGASYIPVGCIKKLWRQTLYSLAGIISKLSLHLTLGYKNSKIICKNIESVGNEFQ